MYVKEGEYCRAVKKAKKAYKEQLCNRLEEKHMDPALSGRRPCKAIGLCSKNRSPNLKEFLNDSQQVKFYDETVCGCM